MRADLQRAERNLKDATITQLQSGFDNWFKQLESLKPNPRDAGTCAAYQGLIACCRNKLNRLGVRSSQ